MLLGGHPNPMLLNGYLNYILLNEYHNTMLQLPNHHALLFQVSRFLSRSLSEALREMMN